MGTVILNMVLLNKLFTNETLSQKEKVNIKCGKEYHYILKKQNNLNDNTYYVLQVRKAFLETFVFFVRT